MSRIENYKNHGFCSCAPKAREDEDKTREGLAYTPAQMYRLTAQGLPVNNVNNQKVYFDGTPDATFHVGSERLRGVDVAELWEQNQQLKIKAHKAALAAKRSKST